MISTSLPNINSLNDELPQADGNSVIFATTTGRYFYPEHKTPYLFVANFLNKGKYLLNKKHIEISSNNFYFLNANDQLEIRFSKPELLQTLIIQFDERFIKECMTYFQSTERELFDQPDRLSTRSVEFPNVPFDLNNNIRHKIHFLIRKTMEKEDLDNLLFELITEFAALNAETKKQIVKIGAVKRSTQEELYRRLFLARELMNDNVFRKMTIEEMATDVCLNKFHFLSAFKSLYNATPHQYFTGLKLQKARELLQDNQHSVTETCWLLGFESVGSFSNLFKKRFKISPSGFASKNKNPNFR